jgi:3-hydroxyisobutyrate dehydrogenase-like beta-hydroxyacid dehydrogenase
MTKIAFLGTGLLGSAFVEAAAARGDEITVWNRTIDKARALEKFGARAAESPAEAVRSATRIHLVLADDAVVDTVIAALRPGLDGQAIIVDHTTTQPALTAARSEKLNGEGVRYIHCPVFIGPPAARQSKGIILAAGPKAIFDEVQPALAKMAERVEYFGERPDLAAVYKLCGNAFIIGINSLVADVFAIASGADVKSADAIQILDFFNPNAIIAGRGKNMIARNYTPTFELTMARKDVRLMIETASANPLTVLPGVAARMDALIASGHGADDLAVLAKDVTT